jgi:hypothetical protein
MPSSTDSIIIAFRQPEAIDNRLLRHRAHALRRRSRLCDEQGGPHCQRLGSQFWPPRISNVQPGSVDTEINLAGSDFAERFIDWTDGTASLLRPAH